MKPKFSIAANDAYQCVLEAFLQAGWQLEKLFISQENWIFSNKQVIQRALELGAAVQCSPMTGSDLAELGSSGCDTLIVACYQWKIPVWHEHIRYAVNFHPSPLPDARGPYPLVRAILEARTNWAVTCHRVSDKFDCGDILDAESFLLEQDETHETMSLKIQLASGVLARRIAMEFERYWQAAVPQGEGSYWPRWTDQDRVIDFTQPVRDIMRQVRAFGDMECMATINGVMIYVHRAKGWTSSHSASPGDVVHSSNLALLVAAGDGFVAITEWSLNAPGLIVSNLRR